MVNATGDSSATRSEARQLRALDDPMLERTPNGACMLRQQESNPKVGPKQLFFSLKIRLVRRGLGTLGLRKSTVGWVGGVVV